MNNNIPTFLYNKLLNQYGEDLTNKIIDGYSKNRCVTLRVNTLKNNVNNVKSIFSTLGYIVREVEWYKNALIIDNINEFEIKKLDIYNNGEIYLQSLSSMIPVIVLNPMQDENILDMAAAPGGKTTQIATETQDKALITACEKNKIRAERLKYNIDKQGLKRVTVLTQDSRSLDDYFSFDRILLDAPCSGSGTINLYDSNLEKTFTQDLVSRSVKFQSELLKKALTVLKPGHEMVYSTCSILKDENEDVLIKLLKNKSFELVPIDIAKCGFSNIPLLPTSIDGTLCVCPTDLYEGFFIAKIKKK